MNRMVTDIIYGLSFLAVTVAAIWYVEVYG